MLAEPEAERVALARGLSHELTYSARHRARHENRLRVRKLMFQPTLWRLHKH